MSKKHKHVVMPTEEEMARYGGQGGGEGAPAGGSSDAEAQGPLPQEPPADQADQPGESSPTTGQGETLEQWKDKYLRARADLANYQRRSEKDHAESLRYAYAGLARALLPVLDDLDRVLEAGEAHGDNAQAILAGVKLVRDNFLKILGEFHVERIAAAGEPFDPQVHEAMMEQPSAEHAERTVLQELAKGYRLYERILRPVKVIVSRPAEPGA